MARTIRIGTRGSELALAQTALVIAKLQESSPDTRFVTVVIKTTGDKITSITALRKAGKGVFVKELERALLNRKIDIAVHSLKDMPSELPEGLSIGAVLEREEAADAFVGRALVGVDRLVPGSVVGTSSLRRQAFLKAAYPYLKYEDMRGNLDTRLAKLASGKTRLAGIIVAAAGLKRLQRPETMHLLPKNIFVPPAGQGALALEIRSKDDAVKELIAPAHHEPTNAAVTAERELQRRLEGGCQIPLGVHAEASDDGLLRMTAAVAMPDGSRYTRAEATGTVESPVEVAIALESIMKNKGATDVLSMLQGPRARASMNGHRKSSTNGHRKPARKKAKARR